MDYNGRILKGGAVLVGRHWNHGERSNCEEGLSGYNSSTVHLCSHPFIRNLLLRPDIWSGHRVGGGGVGGHVYIFL